MDFPKYKRFFAFGCSFTNYRWPTWADLIAKEIPESYNYGRIGAGNQYIYQTVTEACIEHKFNEDDLVIVMFTNIAREDRYVESRNGWITPGTLFYQDEYTVGFMNKFWCYRGYLMRDLALANGVLDVLKKSNTNYHLLSMIPFVSEAADNELATDPRTLAILDFYKELISEIKPSMFETIFNENWHSQTPRPKYFSPTLKSVFTDLHPTPLEHLKYIESIFPNINFKKETVNFAKEQTENIFKAMILDQIEEKYTPSIIKSKHWPENN